MFIDKKITASSFDPIDLFNAGANGFWWDISDSTKIWQESARTTLAGNGDPVGYIDDKSGNGIDWQQTVSAKRPIRRLVGGLWYLEFDDVDDGFEIVTSQALYTNTFVCMAYDTNSDTVGIIFNKVGDNTIWTGIFDSGSTSTVLAKSPETFNSLSVDGVAQSITNRGDIYTAINGKKVDVWDVGLNVNQAHGFGAYNAGTFQLGGNLYQNVTLDTLSAADQSSLETWLAAKAGITL